MRGLPISPAGVAGWHAAISIKHPFKAPRSQRGAGSHPVDQTQIAALSRRQKADKESNAEFESECPGYAQRLPGEAEDTFYTDQRSPSRSSPPRSSWCRSMTSTAFGCRAW